MRSIDASAAVPYASGVHRWLISAWFCLFAWLGAQPARAQVGAEPPSELDHADVGSPTPPPPLDAQLPSDGALRQPRSGLHAPTHFELARDSERDDLTLYVERGVNPILGPGGSHDMRTYLPLCSPPCEYTLRSRSYVLGVSAGNRAAIRVKPALQLREGDRVFIDYDSRLPMRIVGWVLLIAGASAGGVLLAAGFPAQGGTIPARIAGGATLLGLSIPFGLWFANTPDRARAWVEH
jgi:hypothetical protein